MGGREGGLQRGKGWGMYFSRLSDWAYINELFLVSEQQVVQDPSLMEVTQVDL